MSDSTSPKAQLDVHQIIPKKSLGQNFLIDGNTLARIAAAADLTPDLTVVEIGPGTGALTRHLAGSAGRVIAIEIDRRMEPILSALSAELPHVTTHYGDILTTRLADLVGDTPFVVAANVPYYITSAILRHVLEAPPRPLRTVLTIQREVADRLVAADGDHSLLSISVAYYATTEIVARLKPTVFYPRPDVDSAVIRLTTHPQPPIAIPDEAGFFRIVRAGFSQKRKQLKNALGDGLAISHADAAALIERAGIDPRRRAETLTLTEWGALARVRG